MVASIIITFSPLQFIFLAAKSMEDVYLNYVCYAIMLFSATFVVASLPVNFGGGKHEEGDARYVYGTHVIGVIFDSH